MLEKCEQTLLTADHDVKSVNQTKQKEGKIDTNYYYYTVFFQNMAWALIIFKWHQTRR